MHTREERLAQIAAIEARLAQLDVIQAQLDVIQARAMRHETHLTGIAADIEEHCYIASVALLHLALGTSGMHETLMAGDALRLAYRQEGNGDV